MSIFNKVTSAIILLIIGVTWGLICWEKKTLISIPDNVLWAAGVLFSGEKGIDFLIARWGNGHNNLPKSKNTNT